MKSISKKQSAKIKKSNALSGKEKIEKQKAKKPAHKKFFKFNFPIYKTGAIIPEAPGSQWFLSDTWIVINRNNDTIGNSNSLANHAGGYVKKLFIFLWNNYDNSVFEVAQGRGKSALADFKAGKTMFFPKINYPFLIKL